MLAKNVIRFGGIRADFKCDGCNWLSRLGDCLKFKMEKSLEVYNGKCLNKWIRKPTK